MLVVEASSINDLVESFKRKIASKSKRESLAVISEIGDKSGVTKILRVGGQERFYRPYYEVSVVFVRQVKSGILIVVYIDDAYVLYRDSALESRAVDRVTGQIMTIAKKADTLYKSAWIHDDDEKVRERGILALQSVDDGMALQPLIDVLRHDESDALREKAAQFLGRIGSEEAAKALRRVVRSYINGQRGRPGVAAACARALGAIRSREALEDLNELLGIFAKKKLDTQARTVQQAIHNVEHGTDLEETLCIVCSQPVEGDAELLQCPACKKVAHREHLLEWLHVKDYCPNCKKHMNEASIKRTRLENLPPKTATRKGANQLTKK